MATQLPISSIAYVSESFLVNVLDELYEQHTIKAYQYICHKGENGDKDHIHFRVEPNCRLDPMVLRDMLKEPDPDNPGKPFTVRPFRFSEEEPWMLYAIHDPEYMKYKYGDFIEPGEKLPYKESDLRGSDDYDFKVAMVRARQWLKHNPQNVLKALRSGVSAVDLVMQGESIMQVSQARNLLIHTDYDFLASAVEKLQRFFVSQYNIKIDMNFNDKFIKIKNMDSGMEFHINLNEKR